MKKTTGIILALLVVLLAVSCAAGPHQLARTVDDWDQRLYVDKPLLDGILYFIPVIPLAALVASIGDFLIVDAYSFWIKDLWDGEGTGYEHYEVAPVDGQMQSLLIDDAKFMRVK
ncbi:MAG: hypothetical protein EYC70_15510 [Planctomycetota bacterium]|nr:MAG: hypothetical protein EYC70_15510 [Planctomycetota bacterium]